MTVLCMSIGTMFVLGLMKWGNEARVEIRRTDKSADMGCWRSEIETWHVRRVMFDKRADAEAALGNFLSPLFTVRDELNRMRVQCEIIHSDGDEEPRLVVTHYDANEVVSALHDYPPTDAVFAWSRADSAALFGHAWAFPELNLIPIMEYDD